MKKIWYFLLMACFMVGCNNNNKEKEEEAEDEEQEEQQDVKEPKKSVAKETTWDYHLIGKWHYAENGSKSDYPEGIEAFHADGSYECYTQDKKGQKVLITGTWKLDDKKDFVVWVTHESIDNAKGNVSDEEETLKYVISSLAPEEYLTYQVEKAYRTAQWVGQ